MSAMRALDVASILAIASLSACSITISSGGGGRDDAGASAGAGGTSVADAGPLACTPGETAACYDGPAGTEGVGRCRAGVRACAADGSGYGPCTGQVLPREEICGTAVDDDCNGATLPCTSAPAWLVPFISPGEPNRSLQLLVDGNGDLLMLTQYIGDNGVVALIKLDPFGKELARLDLNADVVLAKIALLPDGGFILADDENSFTSTLHLRRFDAAWNVVFDRTFAAQNVFVSALALDASGNIVVAADFNNTIDFGGGLTVGPAAPDQPSAFVAKLGPDGSPLWAKRTTIGYLGEYQGIKSVAADAAGNIVLVGVGSSDTVVDFGAGPVPSPGGAYDVFVAKLDPGGAPLWAKRFGEHIDVDHLGGKLDAQGNVVIVGNTTTPIDFGGGPVGVDGAFAAVLDPAGNHVRSFDVANRLINAFVIDGAGNLMIAGSCGGTLGPYDWQACLARYSPTGDLLFSQGYGDAGPQEAFNVGVDATGSPYFAGAFCGTLDVGTGPVTNTNPPEYCGTYAARIVLP